MGDLAVLVCNGRLQNFYHLSGLVRIGEWVRIGKDFYRIMAVRNVLDSGLTLLPFALYALSLGKVAAAEIELYVLLFVILDLDSIPVGVGDVIFRQQVQI